MYVQGFWERNPYWKLKGPDILSFAGFVLTPVFFIIIIFFCANPQLN